MQKKLSDQQRADYFFNTFDDALRTFFFKKAEDEMNLHYMALMILKEYYSNARQQKLNGILDMLHLRTITLEWVLT